MATSVCAQLRSGTRLSTTNVERKRSAEEVLMFKSSYGYARCNQHVVTRQEWYNVTSKRVGYAAEFPCIRKCRLAVDFAAQAKIVARGFPLYLPATSAASASGIRASRGA